MIYCYECGEQITDFLIQIEDSKGNRFCRGICLKRNLKRRNKHSKKRLSYYYRNRERQLANMKRYREKNRKYFLEYNKKYREENKEYFKEYYKKKKEEKNEVIKN